MPRLMLSYDHRVIDGALFTQYLSFILSDVRRLLYRAGVPTPSVGTIKI